MGRPAAHPPIVTPLTKRAGNPHRSGQHNGIPFVGKNWRVSRWESPLSSDGYEFDKDAVRAAFVDPLTGLLSRYAILGRLSEARAAGTSGSLALLDIDLFKHINDRWGHAAGDLLLVAVARRLEQVLPPDAGLGRFGSDEFLAFLPALGLDAVQRVLDAALARMREPLPVDSGDLVVVTLSAGVTALTGQPLDDHLRACDLALYVAKARGRDRVVVFDEDTRRIATARRELASTVAELQERNRALHLEARTDALTGLRNARALQEVLPLVPGDAAAPWPTAAVAFLDIDHFGNYNHTHGDSQGDEVLRQVAAAIKANSRAPDWVFRKGGEEIVAVLPEVMPVDLPGIAERLREAVRALAIPHRDSSVDTVVTVSVGAATGAAGCTLRQLMMAASDQVMTAKLAGRRAQVHVVHVAAPLPETPN